MFLAATPATMTRNSAPEGSYDAACGVDHIFISMAVGYSGQTLSTGGGLGADEQRADTRTSFDYRPVRLADPGR